MSRLQPSPQWQHAYEKTGKSYVNQMLTMFKQENSVLDERDVAQSQHYFAKLKRLLNMVPMVRDVLVVKQECDHILDKLKTCGETPLQRYTNEGRRHAKKARNYADAVLAKQNTSNSIRYTPIHTLLVRVTNNETALIQAHAKKQAQHACEACETLRTCKQMLKHEYLKCNRVEFDRERLTSELNRLHALIEKRMPAGSPKTHAYHKRARQLRTKLNNDTFDYDMMVLQLRTMRMRVLTFEQQHFKIWMLAAVTGAACVVGMIAWYRKIRTLQ